MNAIWSAVKVTNRVLGWTVLLTIGLALAAVVLDGWYRRLRYRRRERAARAATQQARDSRLLAEMAAQTWTDEELAALRKRGS